MTHALIPMSIGFLTGLSFIVAIGAQNAFVLRQGLQRQGILMVVAICAISDAMLIALGVAGVGSLVEKWPAVITLVAITGGIFLLYYGFQAARRAFRPEAMRVTDAPAQPWWQIAAACLAVTWLNPHVYLDTVLLLGSVATSHGPLRWHFGLGAMLASLCWFAALGYGARLLTRYFTRPASWRVLDGLIAITMALFGVALLASA
ncbi:MAG: amino acid transporter [Corynebacteriales bacterium]|nr:amino acid transporter [Mycobacteriales bacterium]